MDIVKQMRNSIRYIEENLEEKISYEQVAQSVYMSPFNFHRTFRILTGITPNEYIRNRRLSNAGEEILSYNGTVLDLALKYQYDTLEGFSKAFKKFHGFSPSQSKNVTTTFKVYHPLIIDISFKGGKGMDYKIVTLEPFKLYAKSRHFELNAEENLIPSFWDEEIENGLLKKLAKLSSKPGVYGLCHQEVKDETFKYAIGMESRNDTPVDDLEIIEVKHQLWAVFECESIEHIGETWEYILKQFLVNTNYERVEELDFEYYRDDRKDIFCELYIPVRRTI